MSFGEKRRVAFSKTGKTRVLMNYKEKSFFKVTALVWSLAAICAVVVVPLAMLRGFSPLGAVVASLLAGCSVVMLSNGAWAVCFAAFSITPLGGLSHEVLDVTLYFPEVFILALAAREGLIFLYRRERFADGFPLRSIGFYLFAAFVAVGVGFARHNGAVKVMQDFRQYVEFIVLFWVVLQRVTSVRQARNVALCYVLGATLNAVHAIGQQFSARWAVNAIAAAAGEVGARTGSFYHVNSFGVLMVLAAGTAWGLAAYSDRRSFKALMAACLTLCVVASVCTKSRGAWICMAATFAVIVLSLRPSKKTIVFCLVGGLMFAGALGPSVARRMSSLGDPAADKSLMGRFQYYTAVTYITGAHPLLGLGWGCYYDVEKILRAKEFVETPRPTKVGDATVHSLFLQFLVKTGVLGLLGFLSVVTVWFELLFRARGGGGFDSRGFRLFVGISAGLGGCLLQSAWENFFHQSVVAESFWLMLGLSFALGIRFASRARLRGAAWGVTAVIAILFVGFVYGSTWMETADSRFFETNVDRALTEGKTEKALEIAGRALDVYEPPPMAYAMYGRALQARGQTERAIESLNTAVRMTLLHIGDLYIITRRPYYLPEARITFGEISLDNGKPREAAEQFELARPFLSSSEVPLGERISKLYAAYAQCGMWMRALDYGEPSVDELTGLSESSLSRLGNACVGRMNWDLVGKVAGELLRRDASSALGEYLLGRGALARILFEDAQSHLTMALERGFTEACLYLYEADEQLDKSLDVVNVASRVPAGDPVHLALLARALSGAGKGESTTRLMGDLYGEIAELSRQTAPVSQDDGRRFVLRAYSFSKSRFEDGGCFLLLTLWADKEAGSDSGENSTIRLKEINEDLFEFRLGPWIVRLQWVENLLNWDSVETAENGESVLPGWIDVAHDWCEFRSERAGKVERNGSEADLRFSKFTWFFSVPASVEENAGYLLLGDVNGAGGGLGWLAMNSEERVLFDEDLPVDVDSGAWARQAAFVRSGSGWSTLQARLNIPHNASATAFDNIALLRVDEPAPETKPEPDRK
jgi:O-antigen ligase/tetratricopeptide (TPR) repeat protein